MILTGKTEVLIENLSHCHFVHHKSHMNWPWTERGPPWWETMCGFYDHPSIMSAV